MVGIRPEKLTLILTLVSVFGLLSRHAEASRIELEIHYGERQLRLRIRDDGKGMESQVVDGAGRPGHWGLRGMRERAKVIGGNLEQQGGSRD